MGSETGIGMTWENPICPECGEPPAGTVEEILGLALVEPDGKGSYQYAGSTEVWWDDQRTQRFEGKDRLYCENGHDWYSKRIEGEDLARQALISDAAEAQEVFELDDLERFAEGMRP